MQSGYNNTKKWILEFITENAPENPLMGWESSNDTYSEIKLEFSSKELAVNYAKKKKIEFELIEPKKRKELEKYLLKKKIPIQFHYPYSLNKAGALRKKIKKVKLIIHLFQQVSKI